VADFNNRYSERLRLKSGISLSQARFALSNFCLSNLGADGQYFADVIDFCTDVNQLQAVLQTIRDEVQGRCPDRFPALLICVREANDDGETSLPTAVVPPPKPPVSATPKRVARAVSKVNGIAASSHLVAPRAIATAQALRGPETDSLQLDAGISLAHARFILTEFCLDRFGARGQQLADAIDRCTDVAALHEVLSVLGAQVREHHRDALPRLTECVREINETNG
jgi:hypothetical protein